MGLEHFEVSGMDKEEVRKLLKSTRYSQTGTSVNVVRSFGDRACHIGDLWDSSNTVYPYSHTYCSVRKVKEGIAHLDIYEILDVQGSFVTTWEGTYKSYSDS